MLNIHPTPSSFNIRYSLINIHYSKIFLTLTFHALNLIADEIKPSTYQPTRYSKLLYSHVYVYAYDDVRRTSAGLIV